MTATALDSAASSQQLYGRLWRWHFFAALIVIPFVLWQSATGVLYLWNREIVRWQHPALMSVAADASIVPWQAQLDRVREHHPGQRLEGIEISADPRDTTLFLFADDSGLVRPAFVNPHTGEYLGTLSPWQWLGGLSRGLHGGWPIEPWGSYLLELGACWAIVMVLTGLYLWWPRQTRGLAGVLYPRLWQGSRIFWRDLHATVGIWFAVLFLAFLFTALPWTTFWGGQILGPVQRALGQESPSGFFFAPAPAHHASGADDPHAAHRSPGRPMLTLDELVARARAAGARGRLEVHPAGPQALNLRDQQDRSSDEVWLQLDTQSGAVLTRVTWSDFPLLARAVALGVDLHEGTFFGLANRLLNTTVALALVWLSVTGFIGWYRRRPGGGFAAPPRRALRWPRAMVAAGTALCLLLPLLGASVLSLFLIDRAFGRWLPARA